MQARLVGSKPPATYGRWSSPNKCRRNSRLRRLVTHEVKVREVGYRPEPNAAMDADGKAIVETGETSIGHWMPDGDGAASCRIDDTTINEMPDNVIGVGT